MSDSLLNAHAELMIVRAKLDKAYKELAAVRAEIEKKRNERIPIATTKQARVENFIRARPEGATRNEIRIAFPDITESYLNILLFNLRRFGRVQTTNTRRAADNGRAYSVYLAV